MKIYILEKSFHLETVSNSRRLLTYYKTYAEQYPTLALFISCDRMHQMKTSVPRFLRFILYFEF
jgi:hypothetical protein